MNIRILLRGLAGVALLLVAGFVLEHEILGISLDKEWIDTTVRGHGIEGQLWIISAGALFTALGLPRQVLCFLAGYAFDVWLGTLLGLLATLMGAFLIFFYARWWRQRLVIEKFSDKVKAFDTFVSGNPFSMTLAVRLFPVGSNLITNLAAGVSGIKLMPFFAGSLIGFLPQTFIFALLGSGVTVDPYLRISVGIVAFIISTILGFMLYSKYRNGNSLLTTIETHTSAADSPTGESSQR